MYERKKSQLQSLDFVLVICRIYHSSTRRYRPACAFQKVISHIIVCFSFCFRYKYQYHNNSHDANWTEEKIAARTLQTFFHVIKEEGDQKRTKPIESVISKVWMGDSRLYFCIPYIVMMDDPLSLASCGNSSGFIAQGIGPNPIEKATM